MFESDNFRIILIINKFMLIMKIVTVFIVQTCLCPLQIKLFVILKRMLYTFTFKFLWLVTTYGIISIL